MAKPSAVGSPVGQVGWGAADMSPGQCGEGKGDFFPTPVFFQNEELRLEPEHVGFFSHNLKQSVYACGQIPRFKRNKVGEKSYQ